MGGSRQGGVSRRLRGDAIRVAGNACSVTRNNLCIGPSCVVLNRHRGRRIGAPGEAILRRLRSLRMTPCAPYTAARPAMNAPGVTPRTSRNVLQKYETLLNPVP
jgi:hypothetical protein